MWAVCVCCERHTDEDGDQRFSSPKDTARSTSSAAGVLDNMRAELATRKAAEAANATEAHQAAQPHVANAGEYISTETDEMDKAAGQFVNDAKDGTTRRANVIATTTTEGLSAAKEAIGTEGMDKAAGQFVNDATVRITATTEGLFAAKEGMDKAAAQFANDAKVGITTQASVIATATHEGLFAAKQAIVTEEMDKAVGQFVNDAKVGITTQASVIATATTEGLSAAKEAIVTEEMDKAVGQFVNDAKVGITTQASVIATATTEGLSAAKAAIATLTAADFSRILADYTGFDFMNSKRIAFHGKIHEGAQCCVGSFPGKYSDEWDR